MVLVLATLGFVNAAYLYWQHTQVARGRKMFCFLGGDCQAVVESRYGKSVGLKNELWGMGFYLLLIVLTVAEVQAITSALSLVAALFSLYLLYLQHVVLRKYCSWCLLAIGINLAIFLTTLV